MTKADLICETCENRYYFDDDLEDAGIEFEYGDQLYI